MEDIQEPAEVSSPFPKKGKKLRRFSINELKKNCLSSNKSQSFNLPTSLDLDRHDIVACSRTGSVKTADFLIPLL